MIFACVNYGTKYDVKYVQNLYNMVKRNTTMPYKFVCFTDHVKLPKLVEGDIEVRQFKDKYITIFVNILLLLILLGAISGFLLFKYKGKLTPQEKVIKEREKKEYLFKKLQQYSYEKQKNSQNLITNLPMIYP